MNIPINIKHGKHILYCLTPSCNWSVETDNVRWLWEALSRCPRCGGFTDGIACE